MAYHGVFVELENCPHQEGKRSINLNYLKQMYTEFQGTNSVVKTAYMYDTKALSTDRDVDRVNVLEFRFTSPTVRVKNSVLYKKIIILTLLQTRVIT